MLKKVITYENPFTEKQVTEEHYFHISKADMVEMEMEEHGSKYTDKAGQELTGMAAKLQRITEAEDGKEIIATFKDLILRAYGKRTENDRFLKNAAIREDFASSEAFSQLLYELCTDAQKAAEFSNGLLPSNLDQEAARLEAQAKLAQQTKTDTAIEAVEQVAAATGAALPQEPVQAVRPLQEVPQGASAEEPRLLTQSEFIAMDSDELKLGLAAGRYKLS